MVPDDIIRSLTLTGVFRALQPRRWGGLELDLAAYYEGMIRIASACASTGWVASVVGIHPWQVALFADAAQRDVWGDDSDARIASSLAPVGKVRRVDGGYRLAGRWPFSSGVDHCSWALIGGVIVFGGCRTYHADKEVGYEDRTTPWVQDGIEKWARDMLGAGYEVLTRWAGTMGFSPDGLPMVGPDRDSAVDMA